MPGGPHDNDRGERALTEHSLAILDAVRSARIGVCVTTIVEGVSRNVLVSDAAVEILGHPREVLLSRPAFDFIIPTERERLRELRDRRLGGEVCDPITDTVVVHADGRMVPITYVLTDVTIGGRPARVSLLWDNSARRAAEDALRAEEARLRRLFDSAPDGIVVSREGLVLEANPAAARMLGFTDEKELIGTSLGNLMSPVEVNTMKERIAAAREGARLAPRAYEARRRDGSRVTAEITSVPYEHEGKPAVIASRTSRPASAGAEEAAMLATLVCVVLQLADTGARSAIGGVTAGAAKVAGAPACNALGWMGPTT
jgi:PAS domain S-box-containing protein